MNFAHIHLILNHIPIVGIPIALIVLTYGYLVKNLSIQRLALLLIIGLSALVLPVYYSGEPAEELVEHLPGVTESLIHSHEEAAEISLFLTLLSGAVAIIALWFQNNEKSGRLLRLAVFGLTCVTSMSLLYTANLGGKIRHTELSTPSLMQENQKTFGVDNDKDRDDD